MSPPTEMLNLKPLNTKAAVQIKILKKNIQMLRPITLIKPFPILKRKKYAVLLNGGKDDSYNHPRYWNDLKFIYKALKEKYGYTDNEIIVYANGTHSPSGDFDGNGANEIDYAATKNNLAQVMNTVAKFIAKDGKFFFFSTNHGGNDSGAHNSSHILWGDTIKDSDFAALTKKIKCREAIYVLGWCFSGGMMNDILNVQSRPCKERRGVIKGNSLWQNRFMN